MRCTQVYEFAVEIAADTRDKWNPTSRETADHSIPYIIAVALSRGTIWHEDFEPDRFNDPDIRALMQKIDVRWTEECNKLWPEAFPFRITVTMKSGEKHVSEVHYAKGHPKNPLSDQEVEAKFLKLAQPVLGKTKAVKALKRLWRLEDMKSVREILTLFALDSGTSAHPAARQSKGG